MSKQVMVPKAKFAVLALSGMALIYAGSAGAEETETWCAYYSDESTICGFSSFHQCEADISGAGGFCSRSPDPD
jgi:hypothetical protein